MKNYLLILFTFLFIQIAFSQTDPQILMKIDGREIGKDEFLRIYNKNKNIAEDQQKTIDEYLDLFINYKLKVFEAENLGYDTMSSFINEMAKYTDQLTDTYLKDDDALDSLVVQAYKRSLEEIKGKHILLKIGKTSIPKDTLKIYNSIMEIRERLVAGEPFKKVIDEESLKWPTTIGGDLGWFTAFRMVYPFEVTAYNLAIGEVSMPVRTQFGYHIIIIDSHRKNRGEVETVQIMTVLPKNATDLEKESAKQKIEKAYAELQMGISWGDVVKKYSEHKATASKGGYIGWLSSSNAPAILLDSCFATDSGAYSQPFASEYGYHIIKPIKFKPILPFEEVKEDYKTKLRNNPYVNDITKDNILKGIKNEYGFEYFPKSTDTIFKLIDSTIYEDNWNTDFAKNLTDLVFTIGDKKFTQYDFTKYISKHKRNIKARPLERWFYLQIPDFINSNLMAYKRDKLPEKHPELKHLLEEYHDGILLFNLTEDEVWQKAIEDSAGLEKFYNDLPEKYSWNERIAITKYAYTDSSLIKPLLKIAKMKTRKNLNKEQINAQICNQEDANCVKIEDRKYEKGDNALADSLTWKKGSYLTSKDKYSYVLYFVNEVLPAQTKKLNTARGLYTADYQSFLEKQWIQKLRNKYSIEINEEVLEKIRQESL